MSEEIKPLKEPQRYTLQTQDECGHDCEGYMDEDSSGDYVKYSDYESLRRATVSIETAQMLADALKNYQFGGDGECISCGHCVCCDEKCQISLALARFNKEKGGE